jgi:hypothetical protein
LAGLVQFGRLGYKAGIGAETVDAPHGPDQGMVCAAPSVPMALALHLLGFVDNGHEYSFQQKPDYCLPLFLGASLPDSGKIQSQILDCLDFGFCQSVWLLALVAFIVCFQTDMLGQSFFPLPFQGAGYQPIVRIDSVILPARSRAFIAGAFQPLLPLSFKGRTFGFHIGGHRQGGFQRGGRQSLKDEFADQIIKGSAFDRLTNGFAILGTHPAANITGILAIVRILDHHAQTTASAHQQAGQQRLSRSHCTGARGFVRCKLCLIAHISIPTDISGQTILQTNFGMF